MSPVDQIRLERELANKREYTPEEAKKNIAETLLGLAYSTPGIANAMSIRDAFEARDAAALTDDTEEKKRLNANAVSAVLSAFLPFSIGSPASGSAARFGALVPVLEKERAQAARDLYRDLPRSYTRPDLANKEVHRQTGVLFGAEGGARDVISDKPMRLISERSAGQTSPLREVIEHPELFERMPETGDIPISITPVKRSPTGEGFYRPSARTTPEGGFEISENARPQWLREQIAKLLQYDIARRSGFGAAVRHDIGENIQKIEQTIDAVSSGMKSGQLSQDAGMAYIARLVKARDRITLAQEAASTNPSMSPWLREMGHGSSPIPENQARRDISKALNKRISGNVDATLAQIMMKTPEPKYPYSGQSLGEMIVLPQQIDDMAQLAEFLRNWRTYGQGAPQNDMRKMPAHLR